MYSYLKNVAMRRLEVKILNNTNYIFGLTKKVNFTKYDYVDDMLLPFEKGNGVRVFRQYDDMAKLQDPMYNFVNQVQFIGAKSFLNINWNLGTSNIFNANMTNNQFRIVTKFDSKVEHGNMLRIFYHADIQIFNR